MTPNWPELWEREPSLKPICAYSLRASGVFPDGPDADRNIGKAVHAALCRDAAVRWLAERGVVLCYTERGWHTSPIFDDEYWSEIADTPDDALFAACSAKLEPVKKI